MLLTGEKYAMESSIISLICLIEDAKIGELYARGSVREKGKDS
jgi:hypothetical protein